jgi:pSer/pThr/pTyr-binding forkhead associated (FHA) protein
MDQSSTIHEDKGGKIHSSSIVRRGVLLVVSGDFLGETGILGDESFIIGRDSEADLQIPDNKVSGHHCRISSGRDGFLLEDLDSTNGTYLNRKRIKKPALLNYGDRIVLGNSILRFFFEEEI